jgi:cytochrome c6|tara:strand:- start:7808 stop:8131 length:324 start_codon:yes stop_codon:yes gene_type:complete
MVLKLAAFFIGIAFLAACKSEPKTCTDCEETAATGKDLYYNQCSACHGVDGKLGNSGAKDLTESKLADSQIEEILNEGKGAMPAQIQLIGKPSQMDSVVEFVKTLRK